MSSTFGGKTYRSPNRSEIRADVAASSQSDGPHETPATRNEQSTDATKSSWSYY